MVVRIERKFLLSSSGEKVMASDCTICHHSCIHGHGTIVVVGLTLEVWAEGVENPGQGPNESSDARAA